MSDDIHERRLYFADRCTVCGKRYSSFRKTKIRTGMFRKCRTHQPDPNQSVLFTDREMANI